MRKLHSALAFAALLGACDGTVSGGTTNSQITVVNSVIGFTGVDVHIDGHFGTSVGSGTSQVIPVTPGSHEVLVRANGALAFSQQMDDGTAFVIFDSSGLLRPSILSDTGAIVPANKSKLRVIHFAQAAGAIDLWRTQPDFQTPTRVMFPFDFGDESNYIQSDPGEWRVMASSAVANPGDPMPDTLANSGPISVPAGRSRTVVLLRTESGHFSFVVIEP